MLSDSLLILHNGRRSLRLRLRDYEIDGFGYGGNYLRINAEIDRINIQDEPYMSWLTDANELRLQIDREDHPVTRIRTEMNYVRDGLNIFVEAYLPGGGYRETIGLDGTVTRIAIPAMMMAPSGASRDPRYNTALALAQTRAMAAINRAEVERRYPEGVAMVTAPIAVEQPEPAHEMPGAPRVLDLDAAKEIEVPKVQGRKIEFD